MKNDNTRVLAFLMLYYNNKSIVYKVLRVVIYCILDNYVCIDCFCLQKEKKLSLFHKKFGETSYDETSGIRVPMWLLKIVPFYDFVQEYTPTVILTCRIKLVSYYLYKGFLMLQQDSQEQNSIPTSVKKFTRAVGIHENDSVMIWNRPIPSVDNTLNNTHLSKTIFNDITYTYYDDNNDGF